MNFITLSAALDGIAKEVRAPKEIAKHPDFARAATFSEAAAILHQQLHNSTEPRPKWAECHSATRRPVFNDAVSREGMQILEHMAGCYERKLKEWTDHIIFCTGTGLDPEKEEQLTRVNSGMYKGEDFLRALRIGFDRPALVHFLDATKIDHNLGRPAADSAQSARATEGSKHGSRADVQNSAILAEVRRQGHNPLALPKTPVGKSGLKAVIRAELLLSRKDIFLSKGVFDDAWQRLRDGHKVGDCPG